MRKDINSLQSLIFTGLFAAIIYIGIWVLRIPVPAMVGRPFIHFGNTLTAVAILIFRLSQRYDCRDYRVRWL